MKRNPMLQRSSCAVLVAAVLLTPASAQQATAPVTQKPAEGAPANPPARPPAQLVNVKLDLTITDQREGGTTSPKTLTMLLADRGNGRIRTSERGSEVHLNVDVSPEIVRDGRVRVHLTMEYRPAGTGGEKESIRSITESVTTILEDGKQMLVSQSADPASSRTVKVELKATILK